MKPKLHFYDLLILLPVALPFVYLAYVYTRLPAIVPVHFGIDGRADRYGNKSGLWEVAAILAGISILLFILIRLIPKIDPKKSPRNPSDVYNKISILVVLLFSVINCFLVYSAEKGAFNIGNIFAAIMGLFLAVMGNLMHNIKPNYFVGICTPWTLENEMTWRKTHQLAGKIWVAGGLAIATISLLVPDRIAIYVLTAGTVILGIVPVVYSYISFKSPDNKINQ
jgi:uncharacterized membrane protein